MKLCYLKKEELEALLPVATTKEEAEQIKKRCSKVLALLRYRETGSVALGCPHCGGCAGCAYTHACTPGSGDPDEEVCEEVCFDFKFAGLCLAETRHVIFNGRSADVVGAMNNPEQVKAEIGFLEAHIEWANVLIALGGSCSVSWQKMREVERKAWQPPKLAQVVKRLKLSFPKG